LCDRDTMPACAHVVQSICLQVLCVVHTKGATSVPGCAQLFPAQGIKGDGVNRAKSSAHLPFDVRRTSTICGRSKNHDATEQHSMQRVFCPCLLTCQHAATALPRLPCHTPSCCALLYRGCALLTRPVQDAPRSQHPPGPPGRLRLHSVCVCVLVDAMSQCRLMCLLLSGRLPFAKR
jgi:hypothetical protein